MQHHRHPAFGRLTVERLEDRTVPSTADAFQQTNLVADQSGVAQITDPNLVNPWGISFSPTSGAFWVSDNGTDKTTLYSGDVNGSAFGTVPLVVSIPGGAATGQVFNNTGSATDFMVTNGGTSKPAVFLFASENGDITGWNPGVPPPAPSTAAQTGFQAADGAVYKGLALANNGSGNFLYATDFHNGKIDVLNGQFQLTHLAGSFTDPNLPAGFAPFGIAAINGKLYVSYAKQDAAKHDDVAGAGNGVVDVFDLNGNFLQRLVSNGDLNSPWGMTLAPAGFGAFGGDLLVGNFGGAGQIHAFDLTTGAERGALTDPSGNPIQIDGLWGLTFGNGVSAGSTNTLYFTAGPAGESHGLLGKLTATTPEAGRGGDGGPGAGVVAVSGSPNGQAQLFTVGSTGQLTATGSPLAPFAGFTGDVRTAEADVNGDGVPDTIVVTGPGTPIRVAVINGADGSVMVQPFDPFGGNFTGGGFVTAGDISGTGKAEFLVTPDQGGGPRVEVFSVANGTATAVTNFLGITDPNFRGGARATLGDVNGDGSLDLIVAAGFGGGPRVAIFDGASVLSGNPTKLMGDFFAFPGADATNLRNGVFVAAGDFSGDGQADLVFGAGPGGGPRVEVLSGKMLLQAGPDQAESSPVANFFALGSTQRGGVRVAVKRATGASAPTLIVGSGNGQSPALVSYTGSSVTSGPSTGTSLTPFSDPTEVDGIFVG